MKKIELIFPVLISIFFIFLSLTAGWQESLTFDEPVHIKEALNTIYNRRFVTDVINPPLVRYIAGFGYIFTHGRIGSGLTPSKLAIGGRAAISILSIPLFLLVYIFVKKISGIIPARVAVILMALDPTLLAHSHYMTMDFGFTVFYFIAYLSAYLFISKPGIMESLALGFTSGWCLSSKTSGLFYLTASIMLLILIYQKNYSWNFIRRNYKYFPVVIFVMFITVWSTYYFQFGFVISPEALHGRVHEQILTKFGNNSLISDVIIFFKTIPIPLGNWLQMLKNSIIYSFQQSSAPVFFFQKFYEHPEWYFVIVNLLFKLPEAILFFIMISSVLLVFKPIRSEIIFLVPIIVIIIAGSNIQPMIRYILPVYPFIYILIAIGLSKLNYKIMNTLLAGGIISILITLSSIFPNYLSYINFLAGSDYLKILNMSDSNIDWGQGLPILNKYITSHNLRDFKFSYFGQDDADYYGFISDKPYKSHIFDDICSFHTVGFEEKIQQTVIISLSNWYLCGYYKNKLYNKKMIKEIVNNEFLVF